MIGGTGRAAVLIVSGIKPSCSSFSLAPIRHYFPEPDAAVPIGTPRIQGQSTQTGHGQEPSWESHPSEDLSEPPSLRDPVSHGAVTGRKYHYGLFRILAGGSP